MSKLIDADKLIKELKNLAKGQISSCPNIAEFFVSIRVDRIIDILNSQPTAFDVANIIKRLEEEMYVDKNGKNVLQGGTIEYEKKYKYEIGCNYGLTKAIKIVKAGGIDE